MLNIRCAQNESSLNFSVNSEILNSSPPLPQALFSVDEFRLNQQKRTQTPQHTLPARAFQSAKHAQLHSSSPKKELIIAIFLYHACQYHPFCSPNTLFLCAYLVLCGLCNQQQGAREKGMLRAKGSRYGLKGPSDS